MESMYRDIFFRWVGNTLDIPKEFMKDFYIYKTETDMWDPGFGLPVTNVYLMNSDKDISQQYEDNSEDNSDTEEKWEKIRIFLSQLGALFYLKGKGDPWEGPVDDNYYKAVIISRKKRISEDPEFYRERIEGVDIIKAIDNLPDIDEKTPTKPDPKCFDTNIAYDMSESGDESIFTLRKRYFEKLIKEGYTKQQAHYAAGV